MATAYATTLQLSQFMGLEETIPDLNLKGDDRVPEKIGVGDNSETVFFLDNARVIADSYTISYGAVVSSLTDLTETTHYIVDKDLGKITLTTAGKTAVGTNNIYGVYSYSILTDLQFSDALDRAASEVDNQTNNHFLTSTETTPDWDQHLDEVQDGRGAFQRNYFSLQNYPLANISTTLNGAVTADDGTITVVSTAGFPSTGYILIEADKIQYTGKSATTFTGCTSVEAHDDATTVKTIVVEASYTTPGGTIVWTILTEGTGFEVTHKTGRVHLYADGYTYSGLHVDADSSPIKNVASRFRLSYLSGVSTIPEDITKATLMLASKDLMNLAVRKAHTKGLDGFNPALLNVDMEEFNKIISNFRNEQYSRIG